MPKVNSNTELGGVHIRLPFKSMDDVSFSGTYAPLADKLVDTLREHLKGGEGPADAPDENTTEDTPADDDSENELLRGLKK